MQRRPWSTAEVEAEIRVKEEKAAEWKSQVETVKKSLEEQQHQADTALKAVAEKQQEVQHTVQQFQAAEEAREVAAMEAAKAVEERTKATAAEQQHATEGEPRVNEQGTLADQQVQRAVAARSTQDTGGINRRRCRELRPTEQSAKHMPAGGLPRSAGQVQESSHSIESSLQAAGRRQERSGLCGCPDQW